MEPSDFTLGVKGALYPDRRGKQTRLKGRLETNISIVLPSVLALVPEDVRRNVANAVRNHFINAFAKSRSDVLCLYMILLSNVFGLLLQILSSLVDNMKHMVIESLVADYSRFKNERKIHN